MGEKEKNVYKKSCFRPRLRLEKTRLFYDPNPRGNPLDPRSGPSSYLAALTKLPPSAHFCFISSSGLELILKYHG
jgi:hypothetical protein